MFVLICICFVGVIVCKLVGGIVCVWVNVENFICCVLEIVYVY